MKLNLVSQVACATSETGLKEESKRTKKSRENGSFPACFAIMKNCLPKTLEQQFSLKEEWALNSHAGTRRFMRKDLFFCKNPFPPRPKPG
ncbi:MAG: hypothetical protein IPI11_18380 [Haliscomenobacter sp.]|nr:hypothetical protein [Haliscomenobacter sp.]